MKILQLMIPVLCGCALVAAGDEPEKKKNELPEEALTILEKAESLEIFSLEPLAKKDESTERLHGWKILGSTELKKADVRKKVLESIRKGIADGEIGARCFDPRQAIRARHEKKTIDLVICFECSWIYVYLDEKRLGRSLFTTEKPQALLEQLLKDAKIPLARPLPK